MHEAGGLGREAAWRLLAGAGVAVVTHRSGAADVVVDSWDMARRQDPGAWLTLVASEAARTAWLAVDFDNKTGDGAVGAAIVRLAGQVFTAAGQEQVRAFWWPSRSGARWPAGGAGHAFFWLPDEDAARARARVRAWIERALARPLQRMARGERAASGLDPDLRIFFPPDAPVRARLSLCAVGDTLEFARVWAGFCGLGV